MLYKIDCQADIATQSANYPTYKYIDCDLHTNANDGGFYGRLIDCDLAIITTLADACKSWDQGIRTTITIDGIDVSDALIGNININRRKNQIATFSFQLGNSIYSPLTNLHIVPNKVVVITSYLNRYEAKLFTGLIDDASANWTGDFSVTINGSGYGKKLRDTRKTLVSIQDSAVSQYRGDLIKYMVRQAGISNSNIDVLQGTYTRTNHSFEDQTILDMVNKELVIDSMQWEFDEDAVFNTFLDEIKTSTTTYPNPDWTYNENRFFNLDINTTDDNIINDVKIMGTVYETQILVDDVDSGNDSPYNQYVYSKVLFSDSLSYSNGEQIYYNPASNHTKVSGDFTLKISARMWYSGGEIEIKIGHLYRDIFNDYTITSIDYNFDGITFISMYDEKAAYGITNLYGIKFLFRRGDNPYTGSAFTFSVTVNGYDKSQMTSEAPAQSDESSLTYNYEYDQVAAHVENQYSINKYGRRKPDSEGKLEFPLAENIDRCKEIGRKIIKDSHRFTKQPDFEIPFNPLLKVGQTVSITDKKIGYSQRWYVEEVNHTIGQGKGRTRIGCVYYT